MGDTGEEEAVYNCRIAGLHTYFVGQEDWAFAVWAHNQYTGAKRGPHTDNRFGHNRAIRKISQLAAEGNLYLNGLKVTSLIAGGRRGLKEAVIKTFGGVKNTRRPDLVMKLNNGKKVGINVGLIDATGRPVLRELKAMDDLVNFGGLDMLFVAYGRRK